MHIPKYIRKILLLSILTFVPFDSALAGSCETFKDCEALAKEGASEALFELALIYDLGKGVKANPKEAFNWYKQAAENGHINAQFKVGECYKLGQGVKRDYTEAAYWYGKAARNGHSSAKAMLWQLEKLGHINSTAKMENSAGTGFFISKDLIATSLHVVKGCRSIKVSNNAESFKAEKIVDDPFNDIAVLKSSIYYKTSVKLNDKPLKQWDAVEEIGHDDNKLVQAKTKIVHPSLELKERINKVTRVVKRIKLVGVAKPGFSGGPIVNSSGEVIGVMSSSLRLSNTSHTNKVAYDLAINIKYLVELINSTNIRLPSFKKYDPIVNKVFNSTVKIDCINK
jgi:V8-like Glu-specific endopeptidase